MALSKEELGVYPDTRLFWVTDSIEDNEEIFETLEDAEQYIEATDFKASPRITICIVDSAYRDDNDEWNYEDNCNTFEVLKVWRQY